MADLLPLSKTLDPADFDQLTEELKVVDRYFTKEREQHPMRRWEYALALRAYDEWIGPQTKETDLYGGVVDVGGAGSPFWRMLAQGNSHVQIVDPDGGDDLATYLRSCPPLAEAVFCLSVLEHVDDLDRFCYHLSCLVAPGGLLVLTTDYCDANAIHPVDTYHFHWMRKRIFTAGSLGRMSATFLAHYFDLLGPADFTWHGPQVFDYSFASLALVKRA